MFASSSKEIESYSTIWNRKKTDSNQIRNHTRTTRRSGGGSTTRSVTSTERRSLPHCSSLNGRQSGISFWTKCMIAVWPKWGKRSWTNSGNAKCVLISRKYNCCFYTLKVCSYIWQRFYLVFPLFPAPNSQQIYLKIFFHVSNACFYVMKRILTIFAFLYTKGQ